MDRWSPFRPVTRWLLIGLFLLGGVVFWRNWKGLWEHTLFTETIRQRLHHDHDHPFLSRQQSLTNWPVRQEMFHLQTTLTLLTPLQQSGLSLRIPALTWSVQIDHELWLNTNTSLWSGTLTLSGSFLLLSWVNTLSGNTKASPEKIEFFAVLNYLRSWTTTRWYLDDITVTQYWHIYEFPLITRAFLKGYQDTWIQQTDTPDRIRTVQLFSVYEKLTHQIDEHLITNSSGTTQLLIDGPDRWIDALLQEDWSCSAKITFPSFGLTSTLQGNDTDYAVIVAHKDISTPLIGGTLSFTPSRKRLSNTWSWTWSHNDQLFVSGSHQFTIAPISVFSLTPPEQSRDRQEIIAWRKNLPLDGK